MVDNGGPCIYELGRKWFNPWGDGTISSEWNPTSTLHKVRLTPKAKVEAEYLLQILRKGRIDKRGDGYYYADGTKLSKEELNKAIKFGILVRK